MVNTTSKLRETLTFVHLYTQMSQKRRISYNEMAKLAGVSQRTFAEWMRGACSPSAVEAVLRMLALLPGEEIDKALEIWRTPPLEDDLQATGAQFKQQGVNRTTKRNLQDQDRRST